MVAAIRPDSPCIRCGEPVAQHVGGGAPKRYCSIRCRRLQEFEIRRVNRHLESAEWRLQAALERLEAVLAGAVGLGSVAGAEAAVADAAARVAELEARLGELVGAL